MITFKPIEIEDKPILAPYLWNEPTHSADFSFNNIYSWKDSFNVSFAIVNDCLIIRTFLNGLPYYSAPIGNADDSAFLRAVEELLKYAGGSLGLQSITAEQKERLEKLFPGKCSFQPVRDLFDYVYLAEHLANLSGKKLHAKRNHINKFLENADWSFELITPENIDECIQMDSTWTSENSVRDHMSVYDELSAIKCSFTNYVSLCLDGALLRLGGHIIAFTMGERLNINTYVVHFEKAISSVQGSYAMINREFVRYILSKYPEIVYINREEDMGMENLRKAKNSYYPEFLVEKYRGSIHE